MLNQKNNIKSVLFLLLISFGILVYIAIYTGGRFVSNSTKLSLVIDSVRTTVVDSMQQVFRDQMIRSASIRSDKSSKYIELYELIYLFTPSDNLTYNVYDWKTESNNRSINWLTRGTEMSEQEFYREGETVVSVNGKVIECLDINSYPCKWNIILSGVKGGYHSFEITSVHSQELEPLSIEELFRNFRFDAELINQDDYHQTYRVKFPQKKAINITTQWSCNSGGCSLSIRCNTELGTT